MTKFRPILLLGAAVVIALLTSIAAYGWLQKKSTVNRASFQTRPVAVAVASLPWGTQLNKDMIKMVNFLEGSLPKSEYFTDPAQLEGRVLISPVNADEPILRSRLNPDTMATGGVAAVLDPKKRAMAVKVDKFIGVSGFIHPGNRVDVLVTLNKPDKEASPVTKIVLQNVSVLASGPDVEQKGKGEKASQVDVITLELTPEEAEKLALASTQGKIQLALRGYNSTDEVSTGGATIPALLTGVTAQNRPVVRRAAAVKVEKAEAPQKTVMNFNVEILRGKDKATKTFVID